jgi:peptidoglycan/xylan/chitin deacetylase (PgdA/CDA1 family)
VHPTLAHATPPTLFDEHVAWLSECTEIIPLDKALEAAGAMEGRPAVAITFDDGYADNYNDALPILLKYRATATFFITTGFVDRSAEVLAAFRRQRPHAPEISAPLTWKQVHELHVAGMTIGSHTHSHPVLKRLPDDLAADELRISKARIEDRLGSVVDHLAYPFGVPGRAYTSRTKRLAAEAGYKLAACVLTRGVRPADCPLALPRFIADRNTAKELEAKVSGRWDFIAMLHQFRYEKANATPGRGNVGESSRN